jgi:hypothetical protein
VEITLKSKEESASSLAAIVSAESTLKKSILAQEQAITVAEDEVKRLTAQENVSASSKVDKINEVI